MNLRPHQTRTLHALARAIAGGHRRVAVQMPTGAGKTVLAARIIEGNLAKGGRPIFVAPAISLIDQTVERLVQYGIDIRNIGVIQASHPMTDYAKPVQVASAQTLARRKAHRLDQSLVIVDECHIQQRSIHDWMAAWNATPFIGLSATPWAKGMAKHWDCLVQEVGIRDLIDDGYLSPYRIFAASHPDLTGVKTRGGDYVESDLSEAMQRGALVGDTVRHWRAHGEGRPTLVFCVDRPHAKAMHAEFSAAGIPAGYIDAYTDRQDRQVVADQFHSGELKVVCNVGCLTTGVDWDVRCIVMCRPTKSESLWVQIGGRGLRTAEGKADCLILDHSDTAMRLGFFEDVEASKTELCDGKRSERGSRDRDEPLPKPCGSCGYMKPAKTHKCPACGFAPERQPDIEYVSAELQELEPGRAESAKAKRNRNTPVAEKARFFAGLQWYAQERGYKPGWAANQYRERYGVWPNAHRDVQPAPPAPEVRSWIKSQQIRYAKRRAA